MGRHLLSGIGKVCRRFSSETLRLLGDPEDGELTATRLASLARAKVGQLSDLPSAALARVRDSRLYSDGVSGVRRLHEIALGHDEEILSKGEPQPAVFMNGEFQKGKGRAFESVNPANGETIWVGREASPEQVCECLNGAREAFDPWRKMELEERFDYLDKLKAAFESRKDDLIEALCLDTGRPRWEVNSIVNLLTGKIEGAKTKAREMFEPQDCTPAGRGDETSHRVTKVPKGVISIIGPFNLPLHLVNGPMVNALAAGNTVVVGFSEQTPHCAQIFAECVQEAGFPDGVVNIVQGGIKTKEAMVDPERIDGVFFTGSSKVGAAIQRKLANHPHIVPVLEMSGNNPGIVDVENLPENEWPAVQQSILHSAFMTSGQRCVCLRDLYIPEGDAGDRFLEQLVQMAREKVRVGAPYDEGVYMGPLISKAAADQVYDSYQSVANEGEGGNVLLKMEREGHAFVTPGIVVRDFNDFKDEEVFGPLLNIRRVKDMDQAIEGCKRTDRRLASGLWTSDTELAVRFQDEFPTGVQNINAVTTGASGAMPFGGLRTSGNHHPCGSDTMEWCVGKVATIHNERTPAVTQLA